MFEWDPQDYAANSSTQQVWARELLDRACLRGDEQVLDVGCGDGRISAQLAALLPRGRVLGIDLSDEMIRFARARHPVALHPNLEFRALDARQLALPTSFDLVFSNAALHWVDDHPAFLRGVATALKPGGRLLVSCGGRGNAADVFAVVRSTMRRRAWREFFREMRPPYFFHDTVDYERWLPAVGLEPGLLRLAERESLHAGREGFAGWFRTSWLPYTQRIPADQRDAFIDDVTDRFLELRPPDAAGRVGVRMVRLEIDAHRL